MSTSFVLLETGDGVGLVTLNRPDRLNALSTELMTELVSALTALDSDPGVGAMVLTGGPKVFAAGADIEAMAKASAVDQILDDRFTRWAAVARLNKPLIAAVNGYALGGGCELALMCDLIVAGDSARFGQPEINLGIIPGAGGTQRWARLVGRQLAMDLVLDGRQLGAWEALRLGMVNRVVPRELTITVARSWAKSLAARAPLALRLGKDAVNKAFELSLGEGLEAERKSFYFLFATDDQKEGMRAFLEKRPPKFTGR